MPYPIGAVTAQAWARLPDPRGLAALEMAARAAYGADTSTEIVAVPGTQALIQWLPRLIPARRVGILGITYEEHEKCWRAAGADCAEVAGLFDLIDFDVAVVVNPNNPDGRIVRREALVDIAKTMAGRGRLLVVDEAFMDVLGPESSFVPCLPDTGAIVLRSFGKMYGLGGLRLGFAAASRTVAATLREAIGPWAVSGPAIEIGRRALADVSWLRESVVRLRADAIRLDKLLQQAGCEIVGGTPLFRLARSARAGLWFEQLCSAGILTRPFQTKPDWLRFGIPYARADWDRLENALAARAVATPSS